MRSFCLLLLALFLCVGSVGRIVGAADASRPNVVLFFIDDMGWTDLGCMGSDFYETPHIDRLAGESMMFTNAYANAPNCAPSRACLMSGQYTPRHGIYTVGTPKRGKSRDRRLEPTANKTVLDEDFVTIAEALQAAGYVTATMGKWHLGPDPTAQGFQVNIAGREWGSPSGGGYHSPYRYPNLVQTEPGEYLTDRLTDEACRFIENTQDRPFFLYLTHYAVHTPLQGKEELVQKYNAKPAGQNHNNAKYAAMVESVDDSVGKVLSKLDELKLTENTVVIFFSDNGGHVGATSNAPLRGFKGMLYEGGIREPLFIKWPGVTTAGAKNETPVIGIDLYPTLLEVTNVVSLEGYPLDGVSLVPLLRGHLQSLPRESLYWHFPAYLEGQGDPHGGPFRTTPAGAIRSGDWKLIEWFESGRVELYNLRDDLSETRNLAEIHPEKRQTLLTRLRQWRMDVNAPVPITPNPDYQPRN